MFGIAYLVSDIAIFVLKRDVKLQLTNVEQLIIRCRRLWTHFDHLKGQLSLLIFHNFLNVFNPKSHLRVCCLYIGIMFVCARVCVGLYGQL